MSTDLCERVLDQVASPERAAGALYDLEARHTLVLEALQRAQMAAEAGEAPVSSSPELLGRRVVFTGKYEVSEPVPQEERIGAAYGHHYVRGYRDALNKEGRVTFVTTEGTYAELHVKFDDDPETTAFIAAHHPGLGLMPEQETEQAA